MIHRSVYKPYIKSFGIKCAISYVEFFTSFPDMLEEEVQAGDSDYLTAAKLHYQSCLDSNTRFDSSLGKSIFA